MIAADLLRFIVSSNLFFGGASPCYRACSASASALPSNVQASCLEHARPVVVAVFAGALAASSTAPPVRRCPERQQRAKAEGKTKGGGTWRPAKSVCTWGLCGTMWLRRRAVRCMKSGSTLRYRRASYDEARHPLLGAWL